jgi:hypothetical protein
MGIFGPDETLDDAWAMLDQNRSIYDQVKLPEYAEYIPELYNNESYNYELLKENPELLSKQGDNLKMLEQMAAQGLTAEDQLGFQKAREIGLQQARSGTQAALADAASRGVGGGGLEFAMREMANQGGAQRAQSAGLEQAAAAARQRALATQAYGSALSGVRGQDYQTAANNNNVINKFNQMNTQGRNQTNAANVDQRNSAFMYNEGLKDKRYQNQIGQADRRAGLNDRAAEMSAAEAEAKRKRQAAIGGAVGAIGGALVGGPAGAAIGSSVGSGLA